jgi:DNA-directed RNA polymerase subunit alpha
MLEFEKPKFKVVEYIESGHYGKFELEPLERGFGTTIGNTLRRVLLSSMPGAAVKAVKIEGVLHEFSTIEGVLEDVPTIILNLKKLVLKIHSDEEKTIYLNVDREGEVTAADIQVDADVEIINPDLHIATIAKGGRLAMEITVNKGRGYVSSEENKKTLTNEKIGVIATDSIYAPVERVAYEVQKTRVGQSADYDKLIIEIWTDASIKPEEALALAAKILIEHFNIITKIDEIANVDGIMVEREEDATDKILDMTIEELDFSVRAYNCLKRAGINTVRDLVEKSELEMMKVRNLGKKSLKDVKDKLAELGLSLRVTD